MEKKHGQSTGGKGSTSKSNGDSKGKGGKSK
jgi:hypothetical protein